MPPALRLLRSLGLLTLFFAVSLAVLGAAPAAASGGEYLPVGLAAGLLLLTRRHWWPVVLALVVAAVLGAHTLTSGSLEQGGVNATAVVISAWMAAELVRRGNTRDARLRDVADLANYVTASGAGACAGGLVTLVGSLAVGGGTPWVMALGAFGGHLASYLLVLPFFLAVAQHPGVAGSTERAVRWGILLVTVLAAFGLPWNGSGLALAVIPVLGWTAIRGSVRETVLQLLTVGTVSSVLTVLGHGPFAAFAERTRPDMIGPSLAIFLVCCALSSVPFAIVVGLQRDATKRAAAERDRLERFINGATSIAMIGSDAEGRVNLFNPGAQRMLGYAEHEVLGRPSTTFLPEREFTRLAAQLGVEPEFHSVVEALCRPENAATDIEVVTKDGRSRIHSMTISSVHDEDGRVVGHISTGEDVTERLEAQHSLEVALERERRAVDRLQEVDQVKDVFVSSVSHELRTPITSIMGYLELLEDGGFGQLTERQCEAVGRIVHNSKRLLTLIDDLLTLSRVQEGGMSRTAVPLDLVAVVREAANVVAPAAESAGLDYEVVLPSSPVRFVGDGEQLERVVVNLLANAVKFTFGGGTVHLEMTVGESWATITVRDTGVGIPVEEQNSLFSRFFRSSTARQHEIQGSGLGLSIAMAIVEMHHGTIKVQSVPGEGSEFRVLLPLPEGTGA